MAKATTIASKPTAKVRKSANLSKAKASGQQLERRPLGFLSSFVAGVLVAVPLTVATVVANIHPQAGATKTVQLKTAADTLSCSQPNTAGATSSALSGGMGAGHVLGDSTGMAPASPGGSGSGGGSQPVLQNLVRINNSGTISNTGQDSDNSITNTANVTTTTTNNNNLSVTNTNHQDASSGNAEANRNTNGGSATTGDAWNNNSTDVSFVVKN